MANGARNKGRTAAWYAVLVLVALVTALPFLWAALMSVRENSTNVFVPGTPPQVLPVPGLIGWGEGADVAQREGSYQVSPAQATERQAAGHWRDYGPAFEARLARTPLAPYAFPATTANYYQVARDIPIGRYFLNSLLVCFGVVALTLLLCSLAAYPLAKMRFAGRNLLFTVVLSTLVFPPQLILIPLYVLAVNTFHFQDNYLGLILPFAASGLGIFLLRQVYYAVPDELLEAATLDGASPFGIWWRVLLPLVRPGLATLAIITFVTSWNNFLWPLLMLNNDALFTLPVGLAYLRGFFSGSLRVVAAGIVIATVPVIVVFMIFQKQFIEGLAGAVKG